MCGQPYYRQWYLPLPVVRDRWRSGWPSRRTFVDTAPDMPAGADLSGPPPRLPASGVVRAVHVRRTQRVTGERVRRAGRLEEVRGGGRRRALVGRDHRGVGAAAHALVLADGRLHLGGD